jgi:hypothetical protein
MRGWAAAAAFVAAIAAVAPAGAQQSASALALPTGQTLLPLPPHPAETGKPVIFDPQFAAKADDDQRSGCSPGLSCRVQLLGVIQKNGAVVLRTTFFRW